MAFATYEILHCWLGRRRACAGRAVPAASQPSKGCRRFVPAGRCPRSSRLSRLCRCGRSTHRLEARIPRRWWCAVRPRAAVAPARREFWTVEWHLLDVDPAVDTRAAGPPGGFGLTCHAGRGSNGDWPHARTLFVDIARSPPQIRGGDRGQLNGIGGEVRPRFGRYGRILGQPCRCPHRGSCRDLCRGLARRPRRRAPCVPWR